MEEYKVIDGTVDEGDMFYFVNEHKCVEGHELICIDRREDAPWNDKFIYMHAGEMFDMRPRTVFKHKKNADHLAAIFEYGYSPQAFFQAIGSGSGFYTQEPTKEGVS